MYSIYLYTVYIVPANTKHSLILLCLIYVYMQYILIYVYAVYTHTSPCLLLLTDRNLYRRTGKDTLPSGQQNVSTSIEKSHGGKTSSRFDNILQQEGNHYAVASPRKVGERRQSFSMDRLGLVAHRDLAWRTPAVGTRAHLGATKVRTDRWIHRILSPANAELQRQEPVVRRIFRRSGQMQGVIQPRRKIFRKTVRSPPFTAKRHRDHRQRCIADDKRGVRIRVCAARNPNDEMRKTGRNLRGYERDDGKRPTVDSPQKQVRKHRQTVGELRRKWRRTVELRHILLSRIPTWRIRKCARGTMGREPEHVLHDRRQLQTTGLVLRYSM